LRDFVANAGSLVASDSPSFDPSGLEKGFIEKKKILKELDSARSDINHKKVPTSSGIEETDETVLAWVASLNINRIVAEDLDLLKETALNVLQDFNFLETIYADDFKKRQTPAQLTREVEEPDIDIPLKLAMARFILAQGLDYSKKNDKLLTDAAINAAVL
jgi:hypothetical protein